MNKRAMVEIYLAAAGDVVTCEEVRAHLSERLGYQVAGPTASRAVGACGWIRSCSADTGKIIFRRPA